ncbi:MAG: pyrroline-5-carboxylate reductase [Pseudomonadales bacterium]|nr:pyrroline-5-carboxylate reductase [Pseudomonadales bacterium]
MTDTSIGFIGAGNMAGALIRGLLATGRPADSLWASDTDQARLQQWHAECGIHTGTDNQQLVREVQVLVLAVKPQSMEAVVRQLRPALEDSKVLLISVAAGITLDRLAAWSPPRQAIVRCMPNTPALVLSGASALFANAHTTMAQKALAAQLLAAVGTVTWLRVEQDMDAVTALSGSGPAYFFLLMEAMQEAAVGLGLSPEVARDLCVQTALGAAKLAGADGADAAELRRRVSSPGGTTEAAIAQFEKEGFQAMVGRALLEAARRSRELSSLPGQMDQST